MNCRDNFRSSGCDDGQLTIVVNVIEFDVANCTEETST